MSDSVWIEQPCPLQMKRTYYYSDGTYLTKENGSVSWRNNNEGNLRPGNLSSTRIGVDNKNFAVFATPEDGHAAKANLLFSSSSYKDLSLKDAIAKYAPKSDNNDPEKYAAAVMRDGKVDNKIMSTYNADEQNRIMTAMKTQEGYSVGTETRGTVSGDAPTPTTEQPASSTNNKQALDYDSKAAVKFNKKQKYSQAEWKVIQGKLNDELSLEEPLVTDGLPGTLTADAVYLFQVKKNMALKDGKFGTNTASELGIASTASTKPSATDNKQSDGSTVTIPDGATIMSTSYTPDLDLLNRHAIQSGFDVKDVGTSANYVAKFCVGANSQHQCTRGTSLFLQLASYARGEAKSTYASSCAAHLFGSANALTNYNISSSVANEYAMASAYNVKSKNSMNTAISNALTKDGEFVTFKYDSSQHIVFRSNGGWYSDFIQGTATGCGNANTTYSNIHYFTR